MNLIYKYKKVHYGKDKTPILVTRNTSKFNKIIDDRIILPIASNDTELVFKYDEKEKSISEYIIKKENLSIKDVINLIVLIGNLLSYFNKKRYIVGSIDLEDLVFNPLNYTELKLRQTRNLFNLDNLSYDMDYSYGLYTNTQVKYENYMELDNSSDVELLGKIFIKLITNRDVTSYEELRYVGYNARLFRKDMPVELQRFINKTTSIYPQERYIDIDEALNDLKQIYTHINLKQNELNSVTDFITYSCIYDIGKGKREKQRLKGILDKANQDKCGVYIRNNRLFAFVADGVSNCTYGSGYEASKIVAEVCEENIQKYLSELNTEEDAKTFLEQIVNISNKRILDYIHRNYKTLENQSIMCTTFLGALITNDKLYITSIGDSRAYIVNKNIDYALTIDDNYGNQQLSKGITWEKYENLNRKSSLTNVIGNINNNINIKFDVFKITKGDLILLCSDGLTNYIGELIDLKNDWKKQEKLTQTIIEGLDNKHNVSRINFDLVDIANETAGLDNISSILIQV